MNILLKFPKIIALILLGIVGFFLSNIDNFTLDASADSLVLENDKDLLYYNKIQQQYNTQDTLVLTYSPTKDKLISKTQLQHFRQLRDALVKIEGVARVTSILEAPLFESPPIPLIEIASTYVSLQTGNADLALAAKEFQNNPFYQNNLVSLDGKTTAILLTLTNNINDIQYRNERNELRLLKKKHSLSTKLTTTLGGIKSNLSAIDFTHITFIKPAVVVISSGIYQALTQVFYHIKDGSKFSNSQDASLKILENKVSNNTTIATDKQKQLITDVRNMSMQFSDKASIFLGGLPIITVDVITYIQNDLVVFSLGVILCMMLILMLIFTQVRWMLMPIGISLLAALTMTGILGFLDWKVTVISANFFSLLLVMTLSVMVHLIVKYRELAQKNTKADKLSLVKQTINSMFMPCLFTTITTVIAFISLLVSGIRPVIDFGQMMSIGVILALILAFLSFIVLMLILPKIKIKQHKTNFHFTQYLANITHNHGKKLASFMLALLLISLAGISQLSVENRFIDYFKADTEIHQGLSLIDKQLGGTTPLEVIIDDWGGDYWYDEDVRTNVANIQSYLDNLESVGKVLSIDVPLQLITRINNGNTPNGFLLNIIRNKVPENIKSQVILPYLSEDTGEVRFVARIKDTNKNLNRNELIIKIKNDLINKLGVDEKSLHLSGAMVLYNNMLQSLFQSQIATMGLVFIMIFLMFLVVFRSFLFSLLALVANILPSFIVLGSMGLLGIPLDLMTITIAAIAIGIGVDNAIHYIYRFKAEFIKDRDYLQTMYRSHASIGLAMFYTSLTVALGFLVLTLSNFVPSIYFGLFTALAMLMALLANLTLLPRLILWTKPKI